MGKTVYIPEDKISLLKEYFTRGEIDGSGETFFVFFRDKLFMFSPSLNLDEFIKTLKDGGCGDWGEYFHNLSDLSPEDLGRAAYIQLSDIPRVLCGYFVNNELHLSNNMYYDVLNSPEYKKLIHSNNFSKVYIQSESGSREKLVYSADDTDKPIGERYLPDKLYHGTSLEHAINIVTKGLRPSPEKTNFRMIKHEDTVFLAKDVTTACAYSAMLSHSFLVNYNKLPVVIEYDVNKIDRSRLVLDYDVYNSYGVGKTDEPYERVIDKIDEVDPVRAAKIRNSQKGYTVDTVKDNPLRFNRVGYRGVVMPSAINKIYVFYGRDNANMFNPQWTFDSPKAFLDSLGEIEEFCANYSEDDDIYAEEKKILPPYEKDEFEIGSEGGNNDYFHINESIDASEIGEVEYSWDYDPDGYEEWLGENGINNCESILFDYVKDYVSFDLEYFDNETRHHCGFDSVDYEGLEDLFGKKKANEIVSNCEKNGGGRFETCELFNDDEFDVNNPDELNNAIVKQMPHGEYYKGARGFILTNGVMVYTEQEHNAITLINGINSKSQFIRLGNIRVLPQSINIGRKPTEEQRYVLRQIISAYADERLYLDIFAEDGTEVGVEYVNPDWRRVMGEIDRYYSERIKPMGGSMYESATLGKNNTFEAWFGNSVVVDDEGKPLKMYHGSGSEFEEFKKEFIGKNGVHEGYGFNFTQYQTRAASYNNGNVLEVYLRAEHPMTTKSNNITPQLLAKVIAEIDKGTPITDTIVAAYESPKYGEKWDENYYRRALRVAAKVIYDYNVECEYGDAGIYADICLCGNGDVKKVIEVFESLGYDSAIFYDTNDKMNTVVVFEPNQIKKINNQSYNNDSNLMSENIETELDADEVNLSSFKKNNSLADKLWNDFKLSPKARLRLLDIADDFWESTDINWTKPVGIILTGSICNFNWSKFSDIDLHLVVDFREIDEREDFVQEYFDGKKNEWNNDHKDLKIYGYPVEVYVENIDATTESGGIYDLEQNKWIKKPKKDDIKEIGLDKYSIKNLVAKYCTKIDDLCDMASSTDDKHVLSEIGEKANKLLNRIKKMRKFGLERGGEGDPFNIAYKCYRRMGYLDKLFDIKSKLYDRIKSIGLNESTYLASSFNPLLKYFGITSSIMRAGYVLPNGALLDLSVGDPSDNRRSISHRDVSKVGMEMSDVIKMGAIRIDAATGYMTMATKPTPEQVCAIREIVRRNGGCVQVEIGDGDDSLSYAEYEDAKPSKVVADIMRYFDEGIKLEACVNESKEVLREYLDKNYNMAVYKYFKWASEASDDEKAEDLAWNKYYAIPEYLEKLVDRGKIDSPEDIEKIEGMGGMLDCDNEEMIEWAINCMKKYKVSAGFTSYCYDNISCYENPSWMYMDYIRPVKNEWCIHFGSDSYNIAREGFTGGTEDVEDLAYTNAGQQKAYEGYDFAFTIDDKNVDFNDYGDQAVIFRTSGVMCYHYGDGQRQVVFWGPYAKDFIPIEYDKFEGAWVVKGLKGQILKLGSPSEIAVWATENLPQYRKQIMASKNGYVPKYYDNKSHKFIPYKPYRNESVAKYLTLLKEEVNARGNASHDVYRKKWQQERERLKRFLANSGIVMTSKENGKTYYVYYDSMLSNLIGNNYCICVQYDMMTGELGHQVYVRALDKFSQRMFKPTMDNRGRDNQATADDNTNYDGMTDNFI